MRAVVEVPQRKLYDNSLYNVSKVNFEGDVLQYLIKVLKAQYIAEDYSLLESPE